MLPVSPFPLGPSACARLPWKSDRAVGPWGETANKKMPHACYTPNLLGTCLLRRCLSRAPGLRSRQVLWRLPAGGRSKVVGLWARIIGPDNKERLQGTRLTGDHVTTTERKKTKHEDAKKKKKQNNCADAVKLEIV